MFRRQDKSSASTSKKKSLSQYGLFDMPSPEGDDISDGSDDDLDLEAELAALSGGRAKSRPKPKPTPVPAVNLDAMIADSLKDIPSDDEASGEDDDPDLLNELKALSIDDDEETPPAPLPRTSRPAPPPPGGGGGGVLTLLQERISNYTLAEQNAKASGETSRARRFGRGLKTLNDMLKQAKAGKTINEDEIPPVVSTGKHDAPHTASEPPPVVMSAPETPASPEPPSAPETPASPEISGSPPAPSSPDAPRSPQEQGALDPVRQRGLQFILQRKEEFKLAALAAKRAGDKATALEHMKVAKQFDMVVEAYRSGQEMDLSELPTPASIAAAVPTEPAKEEATMQRNSMDTTPSEPVAEESGGLITASSVEEALRQRLEVFKDQEAKAKEQGNSSKTRRMGRIVKQYEQAIKMHAAGKPLPVDELPTPPGYAPLPVPGASPLQQPASAPTPAPRPAPAASPAPAPATPRAAPQPPARVSNSGTRADKQLAFLLQRQHEFKLAALQAKKDGEIALAKEYLRNAKGFDSVIDAAKGGLAVDLKSLPLPPQAKQELEDTFDVISAEDCDPSEEGDVLSRLQEQLNSQLKLCLATRDHNKAMGNVAETNRFEHLAINVKQDLDVVKLAKRLGQEAPKFHYESKQFSVIQCNTDLNENDLELTVIRGITYNVPNPKEVDTYVKFEYPYPQEQPVQDRTSIVKDTNSPEYNAVFPLTINRGARACLRVFKRHGIKLEVYSRGGFFSRDTLLGTTTVKLQPLEMQTTIHEAFPLMDGRRAAGGSLEVKVRVRTPLVVKQVEHKNHRWLVVDH